MPQFIERFFRKSKPEEITYTDFRQFISQQVEENQNLEYKPRGMLVKRDDSIVNSPSPRDMMGFSALARSVSAFANAEGGLLVLGVKERPQKHKGTIVKIRPGKASPLPATVTREMIETHLLGKIQFPLEGVTIVPIHPGPRSNRSVYLIDVPQSVRAPHRVNEFFYFQRHNFDVLEMRHYQIADLFGKRRKPELRLAAEIKGGGIESSGAQVTAYHGSIVFNIVNSGLGIARYPYLSIEVPNPYRLGQFGVDGRGHEGLPRLPDPYSPNKTRFGATSDIIIHPRTQLAITAIPVKFRPGETPPDMDILYEVTAEDMPMYSSAITISGDQIVSELTRE